MRIQEAVNNARVVKGIDPAIYDFAVSLADIVGIYPKYSCQGHRAAEPAWVRFEIDDFEVWRVFTEKATTLPYCKTDENTIYIYHKDKYPDLFSKLNELKLMLVPLRGKDGILKERKQDG